MGALPLGVPRPIALRGRYPLMRHSHEKVHLIYVDGVGCFLHDPPCKGEAQVDDNGHLMPCTKCEALPWDPTMCKWMCVKGKRQNLKGETRLQRDILANADDVAEQAAAAKALKAGDKAGTSNHGSSGTT